jgi:hypothetical protein
MLIAPTGIDRNWFVGESRFFRAPL